MKLTKRQKLFEKPSAQFRGKPFWAWNGKLDKTELTRQIDIMHEMGFGGFFMHSRAGLETEYLGEEAIDTVYGYVTCQKFLETDEGGTVTAWYLDGMVMKIDGTYDGMRCAIDLKGCSFVTPVSPDEVVSDGSMFFYDGSSDTFTGSFDVFDQSMIMTLHVNEQDSARGPTIDVQ